MIVSELSENGTPGGCLPECVLPGCLLPENGLPMHPRSYLVILGYEKVIWHDDILAQMAALQ